MKEQKLAKKYAYAFLEEAEHSADEIGESKDEVFSQAKEAMALLASLWSENKDLQYVLNSPLVSEREKVSIIEEIAKKVWHNKLFINFSKLLAQNKRLSFLKDISAAFEDLVNEKKKRGVVYVFSARELSREEKEKVLSCIASSLRGLLAVEDIQLVWQVDPSILAGIVLRVGDRVFDGSLAVELKALRETLLQ